MSVRTTREVLRVLTMLFELGEPGGLPRFEMCGTALAVSSWNACLEGATWQHGQLAAGGRGRRGRHTKPRAEEGGGGATSIPTNPTWAPGHLGTWQAVVLGI